MLIWRLRLSSFTLTRSPNCFIRKCHFLQLQVFFSFCRKNEKQNFILHSLLKMSHVKPRTTQTELSHPKQHWFILKWNACFLEQNSYPLRTLRLVHNCALLVAALNNAFPPVTSCRFPQKPCPSSSLNSIQHTSSPLWKTHTYVLHPGLAGCQRAAYSSGFQCMTVSSCIFGSYSSKCLCIPNSFPKRWRVYVPGTCSWYKLKERHDCLYLAL